jgi:hypothetical protein
VLWSLGELLEWINQTFTHQLVQVPQVFSGLVVHPNSKPPARDTRLDYFEYGGADLSTLANERLAHRDSFRREIFAKLAVLKRSTDFFFPPPGVSIAYAYTTLSGPRALCDPPDHLRRDLLHERLHDG